MEHHECERGRCSCAQPTRDITDTYEPTAGTLARAQYLEAARNKAVTQLASIENPEVHSGHIDGTIPLVKGGQGRSNHSIIDAALGLTVLLVVFAAYFAVLWMTGELGQ